MDSRNCPTPFSARYLVTGGAGFIGSHLVARLLAEGAALRTLENGATGDFSRLDGLAGDLDCHRGDVRDTAEVARAMTGVTGVFHRAAEVSVPRSMADPVGTYAVNVTGTLNVLEAACAAAVPKMIDPVRQGRSPVIYGDGEQTRDFVYVGDAVRGGFAPDRDRRPRRRDVDEVGRGRLIRVDATG